MLRNIILRVIVNIIAIMVTAALLPGIQIKDDGLGSLIMIALILAFVNAIVKPLLLLLTCPFILITLGLFILVVNGAAFAIAAQLSGGRVTIDNFGWAILGGVIISLVSMAMESVLKIDDKDEPRDD